MSECHQLGLRRSQPSVGKPQGMGARGFKAGETA